MTPSESLQVPFQLLSSPFFTSKNPRRCTTCCSTEICSGTWIIFTNTKNCHPGSNMCFHDENMFKITLPFSDGSNTKSAQVIFITFSSFFAVYIFLKNHYLNSCEIKNHNGGHTHFDFFFFFSQSICDSIKSAIKKP